MKPLHFVITVLVTSISYAWAADQAAPTQPVKATFLITGLHCPPCASTVESSLVRIPGVQSAKVNWSTKNAAVTFDESRVPAQQIALAIADTPHMMGGSMHYSGALALKVSDLKDEAAMAAAKKALADIPGVANVWVYGPQSSVAVGFDSKAKVTSQQLIDALTKAGFTATEFR